MRTIEEAAREYTEKTYGKKNGAKFTDAVRDAFSAGFMVGADFALANQWVSVEDEMPKSGLLVIVLDEDGDFNAARWNTDARMWYCEHSAMVWFRTTVTHWMPIPEPNTEEP